MQREARVLAQMFVRLASWIAFAVLVDRQQTIDAQERRIALNDVALAELRATVDALPTTEASAQERDRIQKRIDDIRVVTRSDGTIDRFHAVLDIVDEMPPDAQLTLDRYRDRGGILDLGVRTRTHADFSELARALQKRNFETNMCFRLDHCPQLADFAEGWAQRGWAYWELSATRRRP